MLKELEKRYDIILSAEEEFARGVALGVLVKRPITPWHILIPGMFILDFLRRSSEIKKYSNLFLFPRKLALALALDTSKGEEMKNRISRAEEEIRQWLTSLQLYSGGLHREQMEVIRLLFDHYSKLLNAEGQSYHFLVRNAYKTRQNYEAYLHQLASVEKRVDQAIAEIREETQDIWGRLQSEQVQVEELRKKEVEIIF
jgi:hypothetical protein